MTDSVQILSVIAQKLKLTDTSAVNKSEEFFRILRNKDNFQNVNDVAKAVLCLDLAAKKVGCGFNKELAQKLSALKNSAYQNSLHNVEKLLNLDKLLTVSELCVQMSCTIVKEVAEKLLTSYKEKNVNTSDCDHPQFVTAAVYTACKIKKLKIDKTQFVSLSRLKSGQWKELTEEFNKSAGAIGLLAEKKTKSKTENDLAKHLEDFAKNKESQKTKSPNIKNLDEQIESYEDWKERILKEAYETLKMQQ